MVRMLDAYDNISVARELQIGRSIALVISEGAMRENNQRELVSFFGFGGHKKVSRYFSF